MFAVVETHNVETDTNVDRLSLPRTSQNRRLQIRESITFLL